MSESENKDVKAERQYRQGRRFVIALTLVIGSFNLAMGIYWLVTEQYVGAIIAAIVFLEFLFFARKIVLRIGLRRMRSNLGLSPKRPRHDDNS